MPLSPLQIIVLRDKSRQYHKLASGPNECDLVNNARCTREVTRQVRERAIRYAHYLQPETCASAWPFEGTVLPNYTKYTMRFRQSCYVFIIVLNYWKVFLLFKPLDIMRVVLRHARRFF